jgi:hypothetical protein
MPRHRSNSGETAGDCFDSSQPSSMPNPQQRRPTTTTTTHNRLAKAAKDSSQHISTRPMDNNTTLRRQSNRGLTATGKMQQAKMPSFVFVQMRATILEEQATPI